MRLGEIRGVIWVIVGVGMLAAMFYLRHNDPDSPYLPALKWFWLPITAWGAFIWYIDRKRRR
ncbi:MAG: hypothetical protein L0Z53_18250 [Acidobacteriales bacterium]|nr:hypothetical protein [Terriglobales bacterium]